MSDVERRMSDALHGLPEPSEWVRESARRAALDALPPERGRRGRRRSMTAVVGIAAAMLVAGVALAATDRLAVRLGPSRPAPPAAAQASHALGQIELPTGASGLALVADGRLWLRTRSGLGTQGLAVSAAELSPNALYAAVGIGRSLVAMTPDGRRAWSYPAGGVVTSVTWAPNPIVVAYVVSRGGASELHVIEGNGDGDRLVDADVSRVRPSWRADTLALAYVAGDGRARVADYPSLATRPVSAPGRRVATVAFAPAGERLALAATGAALEVSVGGGRWTTLGGRGATLGGLAWGAGRELLVAGTEPGPAGPARLWRLPTGAALSASASASPSAARLLALAADDAGRILAVVRDGTELQVRQLAPLGSGRILLRIPAGARGVPALSVR
jgi:hypothetical protein